MQLTTSADDPVHSVPPYSACWAIPLVRCLEPGPQLELHWPHAPHSPQAQFTASVMTVAELIMNTHICLPGQPWFSQSTTSKDDESSHSMPPFTACSVMFRVRSLKPPQQVLLHKLHVLQAPQVQFTVLKGSDWNYFLAMAHILWTLPSELTWANAIHMKVCGFPFRAVIVLPLPHLCRAFM